MRPWNRNWKRRGRESIVLWVWRVNVEVSQNNWSRRRRSHGGIGRENLSLGSKHGGRRRVMPRHYGGVRKFGDRKGRTKFWNNGSKIIDRRNRFRFGRRKGFSDLLLHFLISFWFWPVEGCDVTVNWKMNKYEKLFEFRNIFVEWNSMKNKLKESKCK